MLDHFKKTLQSVIKNDTNAINYLFGSSKYKFKKAVGHTFKINQTHVTLGNLKI